MEERAKTAKNTLIILKDKTIATKIDRAPRSLGEKDSGRASQEAGRRQNLEKFYGKRQRFCLVYEFDP